MQSDEERPREGPFPRPETAPRSSTASEQILSILMHGQRNENNNCVFFRIPIEIRNEIYRLVLVSDDSIIPRRKFDRKMRGDKHWSNLAEEVLLETDPPPPLYLNKPLAIFGDSAGLFRNLPVGLSVLALAFTCRQIYFEAVKIYYGSNTFQFTLRYSEPEFARAIGSVNCQSISRVILKDFDPEDLELMLKLFVNLKFVAFAGINFFEFFEIGNTTEEVEQSVRILYLAKDPDNERTWWYHPDKLMCDQVRTLSRALGKIIDISIYPGARWPCVVDGLHVCKPGFAELLSTEAFDETDDAQQLEGLVNWTKRYKHLKERHINLADWSRIVKELSPRISTQAHQLWV